MSLLFTGSAMATTAIGTLIPILSDAGELRSRFGTYLLAAGAMGEFGPILLITLVFSTKGALSNALILIAFVVIAVIAAVGAVRGVGRGWALLERTLETSGQLAIRVAVVTVFALGALANSLGLDLLLGGFVAGVIARIALKGREVSVFESKLTAVGYGFFIPFFFVVSGINFDLDALGDTPFRVLELPMFLVLFLIVRGVPALVSTATSSRGRSAFPWPSSRPRSCRSWWPSPRSPSRRGTCARDGRLARRRRHPVHRDPADRRPPAARTFSGRSQLSGAMIGA